MTGIVILLAVVPFIFGVAGVAAFFAGNRKQDLFADLTM